MVTNIHVTPLQIAVRARIYICLSQCCRRAGNRKFTGCMAMLDFNNRDLRRILLTLPCGCFSLLTVRMMRQVSDKEDKQQS